MNNITYIIGPSPQPAKPPQCTRYEHTPFHCIAVATYYSPDTQKPVCPHHYRPFYGKPYTRK